MSWIMSVFYKAISNNKKHLVSQMQTTKISGSQNPADIKKKKSGKFSKM